MSTPLTHRSLRLPVGVKLRIFWIACASLFILALFSCRDKEEKRSFSEIKGFDTPVKQQEIKVSELSAPSPQAPSAVTATVGKLRWDLPKGWTARVGTGMFYAILKTTADSNALEISIIALQGEAGGLEANASRWAGQIGLDLQPGALGEFLAGKKTLRTQGGLDMTDLDFNSLVTDDAASSMRVGIAKPGEHSFFIKMMGRKSALRAEKKNFEAFCRSLAWAVE